MLNRLNEKPDIVILDYNLNSVNKDAMEGIDILQQLKEKNENIEPK